MKKVADEISGYTYGTQAVTRSAVSLEELEKLKVTVGFTSEDERFLHMAGEALADQTKRIVEHWRSGIIANIPDLARHSAHPRRRPDPTVPCAKQSSLRAMDPRYLFPYL